MTDPYAALRQCVEALYLRRNTGMSATYDKMADDALTTARAALDARQEPVGWMPTGDIDSLRQGFMSHAYMRPMRVDPALGYKMSNISLLYTTPPAPQTQRPVRLTDERMIKIFRASDFVLPTDEWALEVARVIEAEVLRLNGIGGGDE